MPNEMKPLTLRQVLDAGVDPREMLGDDLFEMLMDNASSAITCSPEHRAYLAEHDRQSLEEPLLRAAFRGAVMVNGRRRTDEEVELAVIEMRWRADMYDDPDVVPRLLEFATHEERRAYDEGVRAGKRPYPMSVDVPEWTFDYLRPSCRNCGAFAADDEEMLVIRSEDDELPRSIRYCRACVELAAAAFGTRTR